MTTAVEQVKNLLYRCEFRKSLIEVESYCSADIPRESKLQLQLYKTQALFEMHCVKEAKNLLASLSSEAKEESVMYLFVTARMAYFDGDYERAERLFKLLSQESETLGDYYRALIGLANTYYSLKQYNDMKSSMADIEEMYNDVAVDSQLSFLLLKANRYIYADNWLSEANKQFYEVIKQSQKLHWNYFIIKALYGLAVVAQAQENHDLLNANLQLLRCYLEPEEAVYLTYLVNNKFKEDNFAINYGLRLDREFKRVGIQGRWIALHDKPVLYNFLELLNSAGRFVSKQEIATHLWPDQEYNPKRHDPRIFDIARRIRGLIEPYDNQPVTLLSGRNGYKLASPDASGATAGQPKQEDAPKSPTSQVSNNITARATT